MNTRKKVRLITLGVATVANALLINKGKNIRDDHKVERIPFDAENYEYRYNH